ncbi:hypothetical protein A4H96_10645 [Acidithiobacillus ferrooxidans]|uniref:Uncharacterized protein n=1 Tax=Acidithiobacillus ferrooxidans TaxID=920 RepID=A0A179BEJ5_ACIFR|nr:hypothetical protein A4H96_10645 [Acidithiobacillus ferrooxidans]
MGREHIDAPTSTYGNEKILPICILRLTRDYGRVTGEWPVTRRIWLIEAVLKIHCFVQSMVEQEGVRPFNLLPLSGAYHASDHLIRTTNWQRERTFKGKTYVLRAKLNKFTISIVET